MVLLVVLLLLATACGSLSSLADEPDDRLSVVASFSVLGEIVEAVGGERVAVTTIVPVGADPHDYEPRPSDVAAIAGAAVTFDNGLGLSPWLRPLRVQAGGSVADVGQVVGDAVATDASGRPDPHVWLDPQLMAEVGDVVADVLADADPAGAEGYAQRARELRTDLDELDAELVEILAAIPPERRVLLTHEHAFSYFAEAYDFEIVGTVIGATTEEEPSAARVRQLVDVVEEHDVPAVFPQSTEPADVIERIAGDTDARLGQPLHVDSVGEPGSPAGSYAGMLRANAEALVAGLTDRTADNR